MTAMAASQRRGPGVTIEPINSEDQLFLQLRTITVQRLRAAQRGDRGICVLLERVRQGCLAKLEGRDVKSRRRILSAA
jgi:hypothetical protein